MRAIYFWADYCGTCHEVMEKVIDPLIIEGLPIVKVDGMREPWRALKYDVNTIPLLVFVNDEGDEVAPRLVVGAITAESVRRTFEA